ncbi:FAD-dependent thymidylate synthase [Candidatus Parcubacteria bacterium]|nr:FAD-dependent thymidylate synthase [Candidatus Parcubacteria bacterium]
MIKVELLSHSSADPIELTSHAALACYQSIPPQMGKKIDIENRLFNTGHHTTLQHNFFTFNIEGISVGDITTGMHLAHPFYNSDQRSGRYCAKMFLEPDFDKIEEYIKTFWPDVENSTRSEVMTYIKNSVQIYHDNIKQASEITKKFIKEERPFVSDKAVELNGPKIAQEQMRVFIPIIFPTGFDFTINITVLAAIYQSAWTPAMKYVTEKMAELVMKQFPDLEFIFDEDKRKNHEWAFDILNNNTIKNEPALELISVQNEDNFIKPLNKDMHPVDLLHFLPKMMDNSIGEIETKVEMSIATMGQDQRHRTIRRGKPAFTGNFYLPSIPEECGLEEEAKKVLADWKNLKNKIPKTLHMIIAPYGAMVSYTKKGSFNAIAHEQGKRLCFCAQEEIYHLGRLLRLSIQDFNSKSSLLNIFEPPCYRDGICAEGARYCGRDLKERNPDNFFPKRKI